MKKPKEKKPKEVYLHIRIEEELKKQLEEAAEEEGRTPSNLVRWLIREYVNS